MPKKTLIYIVGEPGIGKSTTVEALVAPYNKVENYSASIPHLVYADKDGVFTLAQLGKNRENFSGTDALPMNIIESATKFFTEYSYPRILAEGARLANKRFLQIALDAGYKVVLVALEGQTVAEERRQARGSKQAESWVKGRRSASRNLADNPPNNVLVKRINASLSPEFRAEIIDAIWENNGHA